MKPILHLIRASFPERPVLGAAVSRAILERVAAGELPEAVRLGRPGRVVAFGKRDIASPGYKRAIKAAREAGYDAAERLAGGRAAAYTEGTLSFSRAYRDPSPRGDTEGRFVELAELIRASLARLGVDARVGEVAGEYCPGAFSVNAGGRAKLAGIGQRLISGGAFLGSVVVAGGADELRRVLEPVYAALELEWDPTTTGAVEDEVSGVGLEDVEEAILTTLGERFDLIELELDQETMRRAEALAPAHEPAAG